MQQVKKAFSEYVFYFFGKVCLCINISVNLIALKTSVLQNNHNCNWNACHAGILKKNKCNK